VIAIAAALALAASTPSDADLGARIRNAAAGSQALQGPLDGAWTLYDARHRSLYVFQITDPADGTGALEAAWRGPGASAATGLVTAITRQGNDLSIDFAGGAMGETVSVRLQRRDDGEWSGRLTAKGRESATVLRRRR